MGVFRKKDKAVSKPAEVISPGSSNAVVSPQPVSSVKKTEAPSVSTPAQNTSHNTMSKQAADRRTKLAAITVFFLLLVGVGLSAAYYLKTRKDGTTKVAQVSEADKMNQALLDNDKSKALEHAKKALDENPTADSLLAIANLTKDQNAEEAKQYYVRAFEIYKKENNLDDAKQTAITYWAAAGLAEQAGYVEEAKKYYKRVVETANQSDGYEKNIAKQSEAALTRLK